MPKKPPDQAPRRAATTTVTPVRVSNTWKCPECQHIGILNYHKYCAMCGRRLEWTRSG